ncbi:MAG: Lipoyl synthase [Syntrophus sp. PtaB.Bin075]|nr:MAG: Lipoyl synthase [Syntrophus sp. PtaB.Bin075]
MSERIPAWLREEIRQAKSGKKRDTIEETSNLLARLGLSTVCDSARCPNRRECFSHSTATFLILGEICTRDCSFCAVKHGRPEGPADAGEPERLASAVSQLGLSHVVITSVTRDDLPDGGAGHYALVIQELHRHCPDVTVEVLVPDFMGSEESLAKVLEAGPHILTHNVETVPRLYGEVRRGADYERSLTLLRWAGSFAPQVVVKSGFMLGLGETAAEIEAVLQDLVAAGCDMVTIGQYLSPSLAHFPVIRYVTRHEFAYWREAGLRLGLRSVASGPLVRSSYKAPFYFGELL